MTIRPIIFSAPMVLALLAGSKTQTRRLAWREKEALYLSSEHLEDLDLRGIECRLVGDNKWLLQYPTPWQKVQVGDSLWVRESFKFFSTGHDCEIEYCNGRHWQTGPNTGEIPDAALPAYFHLVDRANALAKHTASVPSIHMPRWASRLTLTVTDVKVENLKEISEEDARAEGSPPDYPHGPAINWFYDIWTGLHGEGSWAANPEVCVVSFRCIKQNIDQVNHDEEN